MKESRSKRSTKSAASHARQAEDLVQSLRAEFGIEDAGGRALLAVIKEARIRQLEAQAVIDAHGAVVKDRFGQLRANPACVVERDSRTAILSALRQLHLDVEPPYDGVGRPPNGGH
jgi:hypothetical protein